jgi:hypothetical protein
MYEISNQVMINAPVDQVWNVLTDLDRFYEWNPVIRRVEGRLAIGEAVRMTASSPDGEHQWICRISRHRDGREFAWQFTDRHPLLYRGEHTFCVLAIDAHSTCYIDVETFHGLLVPSRRHVLATHTRAGMAAMGVALKQRAETGATSEPDGVPRSSEGRAA